MYQIYKTNIENTKAVEELVAYVLTEEYAHIMVQALREKYHNQLYFYKEVK